MSRILQIQSSPNLESSVTRELTDKFVAAWQASHEGTTVEVLDLVKEPLPHFGPEMMGAMKPQEEWSDETKKALALSDKLVTQLEEANIIVIGSPMINFTICSQLKVWIDHVTIAGRTFSYSAPGVAKGLLFGKKVFIISARGGDYSQAPINAFDFQEPLLRTQMGFIGMYDVNFIRAEGHRQRPEESGDIMRYAESVIERVTS